MKNKRNLRKQQIVNSIKTRKHTILASGFYLPDDCWESVFKSLIDDDKSCLKSVSLVSKQFLSITNRLRSFPLTILNPTLPFISRILRRFPNITSIDLSHLRDADLDDLLLQISRFPLKFLTSLNLSRQVKIPADGLRALSQNITTPLTSLTCRFMCHLSGSDLFLIADCFPLLEELDIAFYKNKNDHNNLLEGLETLLNTLSKLRKIDLDYHSYINNNNILHLFKNNKFLEEFLLYGYDDDMTTDVIASVVREMPALRSFSFANDSGTQISSHFIHSLVSLKCLTCLELSDMIIADELLYSIAMNALPLTNLVLVNCINYTYAGISALLSKCRSIQHLDLSDNTFLNDQHVAELSLFLSDLVSVNLSDCSMLTHSALLALARNCPSLSEICMHSMRIGTRIGKESAENMRDFVVNHQLKSLRLPGSKSLQNEDIIKFATIFPNIEILDLSYCDDISEEGIGQVLMRCGNIKILNLANCSKVKLLGMKFELPKLEVLNLSSKDVCDETLYMISKSCCGLLNLILRNCVHFTNKGMQYVVENCTQLREIDLRGCDKVDDNFFASMVLSRPSLRRIYTSHLRLIDTNSYTIHSCLNDTKRKHLLNCYGCLLL